MELVVSRLEESEVPILVERVPWGATSWTPPGGNCFEPGSYVWFLRQADVDGAAWSEGRAFEVSSLPSREEIERSLVTLQRYLAETEGESRGGPSAEPQEEGTKKGSAANREGSPIRTAVSSASLSTAAIIGHVPGTTGSHVGVVGTVDSPDAAGLAGQNTAGGVDLYLAGPVAAEVTESQWTLDGAGDQTFGFSNPSGGFSLQVQGEDVLTTGDVGSVVASSPHDHFGESWVGTASNGLHIRNEANQTLLAENFSGNGFALIGWANNIGVYGLGGSDDGVGVYGQGAHALQGVSYSADGAGGVFINAAGGNLIEGFATTSTSGTPLFRIDNDGNVSAQSFTGDGSNLTGVAAAGGEPPSLFGTFGGTSNTDRTISGTQNLGTEIARYRNLIVPAGSTLVVDKGIAFVAVSGTCDIAGTITAAGRGRAGGVGRTRPGPSPGAPGTRADLVGAGQGMTGGLHRIPVPLAVAGAGGGGGGAGDYPLSRGGDGGGAEWHGGEGGYTQDGTNHGRDAGVGGAKRFLLTHGAAGTAFPELTTDYFTHLLYYPGAGGGAGATGAGGGTGGSGGNGGGIIYLECRTASFTGTINIRGMSGSNGIGNAGGGGGGGGGIAIIRALNVTANTGTVEELGGVGGSGSGALGGNGGNGRRGYFEIVDL